jgi:hypothetical protein
MLFRCAGGVSSEIFRVDLPAGRYASSERCRSSRSPPTGAFRSSATAPKSSGCACGARSCPGGARILGEDRATGCFAMAYLSPDSHPVWKDQLRPASWNCDGRGDRRCAWPHPRGHGRSRQKWPLASRRTSSSTRCAWNRLPRSHGAQASDLAPRLASLVEITAPTKARARPRRLQPEEPAVRAAGP